MRNEAFATLLNQHLQRTDRSASWLARKLQVAPSTVTRWVSSETMPDSAELVLQIAAALELTTSAEKQALLRAAGYTLVASEQPILPHTECSSDHASIGQPLDLSAESPPAAGRFLPPKFMNHDGSQNGAVPMEPDQSTGQTDRMATVTEKAHWVWGNRPTLLAVVLGLATLALLSIYRPRLEAPAVAPTPLPAPPPTPLPTSPPATPVPIVQHSVTFYGPVGAYINDVQNSVIIVGDTPALQQQKAQQRAALIAGEIRYYLTNVAERLALVETALQADDFGEKLAHVRATVAPALQTTASAGYRELIAQHQISALHQQFNSYPLAERPDELLLQLVSESELDETSLRFFYDQLGEVRWATEILLDDLAKVPTGEESAWVAYYQKRVALAVDTLKNRSALAQISGLTLLFALQTLHPPATANLSTLISVTAELPTEPQAATQLLAQLAMETANLQAQRMALVAEGERLLDDDLKTYEAINQELVIRPDDEWQDVVRKAITLRQLGQIKASVAAFAQYGQMFTDKDETAQQYADTARQFTLQMELLGVVDGAVYIYAIEPDSAAHKAGLAVGDIIIECNAQTIYTPSDLELSLAQIASGEAIPLTYLRLGSDGSFQPKQTTINSKPLGISFMPI